LKNLAGDEIEGISLCSVVPRATPHFLKVARDLWPSVRVFELNHLTVRGLGIDYPRPETIGTDRLANALAALKKFGAPALVVDFGTAVTFDIVDAAGNYAGGIIAPGLSAMTDYLHEKTALLPRITIRDPGGYVGKSTEQAMLIGAVHGYRGLIKELIVHLKEELKSLSLPVVATGGCAELIALQMAEIQSIDPHLTLDGLRLAWSLSEEVIHA
jgi:type III pantothenate kinase